MRPLYTTSLRKVEGGEARAHFCTVAGHRADQVFLPVLENAVKAQKLRSTMGVFEKSKFLFNLPGQLMDSINAVSYTPRVLYRIRSWIDRVANGLT